MLAPHSPSSPSTPAKRSKTGEKPVNIPLPSEQRAKSTSLPSSSSTPTATSAVKTSPSGRAFTHATAAGLWSCAVLLVALVLQTFFFKQPLWSLLPFEGPSAVSSARICVDRPVFLDPLPVSRASSMSLKTAAERVAAEFDYSTAALNQGVKEFGRQMEEGLMRNESNLAQIPTYVTAVPNGTEKGLYLAVDLGGTNFRVCSIHLNGDTTFSLTHSKVAIPRDLMVAKTSKELFSFLAKQIELFLKKHHEEHYRSHVRRRQAMSAADEWRDEEIFQLGFTFSFPVHQVGINRGTLIRWTKGFDIADTIGQDVCALLQAEIDELGLPVRVAALVNDTVGTLMARSYTSPGKTKTLLGAIFGTGTNGAYVERLHKVKKMDSVHGDAVYDRSTGDMIINTEWGSFDNGLSVLPNTPYDADLDLESVNPGVQMFEKRISGMFLGEILRRALLALQRRTDVQLFRDESSRESDIGSTTTIQDDSPLFIQWGLDTSFLSIVAEDGSPGLHVVRQELDRALHVDAASIEDAEVVKLIAHAVAKRAARLSAVAIAGVVINTGKLMTDDVVDIGVDGSLVEYYPGFEDHVRAALREIDGVGPEGEKKIRIGIAKDGSGVGAALIALVASNMGKEVEIEKWGNTNDVAASADGRRP